MNLLLTLTQTDGTILLINYSLVLAIEEKYDKSIDKHYSLIYYPDITFTVNETVEEINKIQKELMQSLMLQSQIAGGR